MVYDEGYEFYKFIETLADDYVPLSRILKNEGMSYEQAAAELCKFRSDVFSLMEKYHINTGNVLAAGLDICELIENGEVSDEMIYLFSAFVTDLGVLFDLHPEVRNEHQDLMCWFEQRKNTAELFEEINRYFLFSGKIKNISELVYTNLCKENIQNEQALLFGISRKEKFLSNGDCYDIFMENTGELVRLVNAYEELSEIKPYVYFAVLTRKHKMMLERAGYTPNISAVFKKQEYKTDSDNGKNFRTYDEYIDLYCRIREYFLADPSVNTEFSDFCFSEFSNLSEWYYSERKDTSEFVVPMSLTVRISSFMSEPFPDIADREYCTEGYREFRKKYPTLVLAYKKELTKNPDIVNEFTEAYYDGKSTVMSAAKLFDSVNAEKLCDDTGMAMAYAEYYLGVAAEICLRNEMSRCFEFTR